MTRWVLLAYGGSLGRLLRARGYLPTALTALALLVMVTGAQLLMGARLLALLASPFASPHTDISITGPGVAGASSTVQAFVLGAVVTPGVYALPPGARVHDLIAAAGGATSTADLARVSLAAALADGQTVYVPHVGEAVPLLLGGKVNLNAADEKQLHDALGIGLDIARRIVAYRTAHGHYSAVSQLLLVPISRTTYDKIKDLVTV